MEYCEDILKDVAKAQYVENPKIVLTPGSKPGQGFLGIHQCAEIDGTNKKLNVFVKIKPTSTDQVEQVLRKLYLNEFLFYDTIYPMFRKFQEQYDCPNPFHSVARCYRTESGEGKETLVVENLKVRGFTVYDGTLTMDDRHIECMLEELAHFHAISFAMKYHDRNLYNDVTRNICCVNVEDCGRDDFINTVSYFADFAQKTLNPLEDHGVIEIYKNFSDNIVEFLESLNVLNEDFTVVTHGDLYYNNIMFSYKDKDDLSRPTDVCFLDWQLMRVGPPVLDVAFLFYCSCDEEQMNGVTRFLILYYRKLCLRLADFGVSAKVYPMAKYLEQWRRFARYGLALSFLVLKIMLTEPEDVKEQSNENARTMLETLSYDIRNVNILKKRMKSLIYHFVDKDFLNPF